MDKLNGEDSFKIRVGLRLVRVFHILFLLLSDPAEANCFVSYFARVKPKEVEDGADEHYCFEVQEIRQADATTFLCRGSYWWKRRDIAAATFHP